MPLLDRYPDRVAPLAIDARSITKTYPGGVQALSEVSFQIGWGTVFAFLGRNGSGKTTTVRVLTTLTPPTTGTATVAGFDVAAQSAAARSAIGVTMQEAALDDLMTGAEHLQLVGQLWGGSAKSARGRAGDLLEWFGLADAADRRIATYSGGMRRRLDIATAVFNQPRVLFLDEPTTGLDPQSRRAVWSRIREARDNGATVFLTTQYLEEAEELADTVAIIDGGRVVASGTVADLTASFGRTTIRLRVPDVDVAAVKSSCPDHQVRQVNDGRLEIEMRGPGASGDAVVGLLHRLATSGIAITDLAVTQASLEDVFVRLTAKQENKIPGDGNHNDYPGARSAGALGGGRM